MIASCGGRVVRNTASCNPSGWCEGGKDEAGKRFYVKRTNERGDIRKTSLRSSDGSTAALEANCKDWKFRVIQNGQTSEWKDPLPETMLEQWSEVICEGATAP